MSDAGEMTTDAALLALITSSLVLWGRAGNVLRDPRGAIVVESETHAARIQRAPAGVPFRWSIEIDGRRRLASSVPGILRVLRAGLDPEFRPSRVRIAPIQVEPS